MKFLPYELHNSQEAILDYYVYRFFWAGTDSLLQSESCPGKPASQLRHSEWCLNSYVTAHLLLSLDTLCTYIRRTNYSRCKVYLLGGGINHVERHKLSFEPNNSEIHPLVLIKFNLGILPLHWLNLGIWMEERPEDINFLKAGSFYLNNIKWLWSHL